MSLSSTPRSTLTRLRERARSDRTDLYAVLDAGLVNRIPQCRLAARARTCAESQALAARIERKFEYNPPMSTPAYVPPGWPSNVRPPGSPGWEATAIAYLLDCCPADFRAYPVLRNHPVVLAQFATHFVNGQQEASRRGLAEVRTSLGEYVDPTIVEAAAQAWLEQGARLTRTRRAVSLLEEALRGRVFVPKL